MGYCEEDEDEDEAEDGFGAVSDTTIMHVIEDTLNLMEASKREQEEKENHKNNRKEVGKSFKIGDRVEGNYCLEGSFYPGVVDSVSEDGKEVVIRYDDDDSTETLTLEHVRLLVSRKSSRLEA